jgi:rod shape-determining protein MreB and related proteins
MAVRSGVAIDLGTVNTLVYVTGRGIVIDEPSAIGIDRATGAVAASGQAADALTGKETQDLEVLHPLRDGVIADLGATAAMLQDFLRRASVRRGMRGRQHCVVCLPGEATEVERQSVMAAAYALKPRFTVQLVEEPVAAAAGAGFDLAAGTGSFVVDIGGGTTEAAVLAGQHVVRARSLRTGGNAMDEAITKAVRREFGLLLGRDAARGLKMTLGLGDGTTTDMEVVGIDAGRRTPRVVRVPTTLISAAVEPMVRAIIGSVTELLADIPPNLAEDVFRGKIRLAGGGAMLPGLSYRLEAAADIPVTLVEDPLRCVIRGAALILENSDAAPTTSLL